MRRPILAAILVILLVGERSSMGPRTPLGAVSAITARPVALDPADPARRNFGRLRLLEAWRLDGEDREFGGFSTLVVEGRTLIMLTDGGGVVRLRLGRSGHVDRARFGDLAEGPGDGRQKEARDAEAMARAPGGDWWVAFERSNAVARYDAGFRRMRAVAFPSLMRGWRGSAGAEAMVALPGLGVLMFKEGGGGAAEHPALLFRGDPAVAGTPAIPLAVRPPAGFRVVDAARTPDGRVIALHRRFAAREMRFAWIDGGPRLVSGFSAMIGLYDPRAIRPGAVLRPRVLATLAPPLAVDNFEGIAVGPSDGGLDVWIVSDNNKKAFQRTLVLRFRLIP